MKRPASSLHLPVALLLGLGCATTPPPPPAPAAPVVTAASTEAPPPATPASPWDGLDAVGLGRIVGEGAGRRLTEVQPDFDQTRLGAFVRDPSMAPALSGRACDQLLDLAIVALSADQGDAARGLVELVRTRARNRNLAFAGSTLLAEAARRGAGDDPAAQQRAVEAVFGALPRSRLGGATVMFQLMQTQGQLDARLAQVRQQLVSPETARTALYFSAVLPEIVRNRALFLAAIEAVRARNEAQPPETPYAFSTVDLTGARDAREVRVAVWDVGTNPELFRAQLFTNPGEQANGQDDDRNGQVDDLHGLASDGEAPNTALLFQPAPEVLTEYGPFLRGVMDLRAGLATSEAAQRVLALQRSVTDAAAQERLDTNLEAVGEWAHGTHVGGILLAGVPSARMAIFRSAWAGEHRLYHHRGPTDAELDAEGANIDAIAEFINRHQIRVVNASLGFSREYVEASLRHQRDVYTTDEAVRARAEVVHARRRTQWQRVFERCPGTLFVVAAGNSNQDVVEYGEVPAAQAAPNLLVVGAVDRFGQWAPFTNSNLERVRVFDHGVEVDSVVPDGSRVPLSGTSMASPNVANLAAKLYALDPALTPPRAIAIIEETGEPIAAPFYGRIAHEARAIARVRRERGRRPAAPARAAPARS